MKLSLFGLCAIAVLATLPLWNTHTVVAPSTAPQMDTSANPEIDTPQAHTYHRYYGGSGRREILS